MISPSLLIILILNSKPREGSIGFEPMSMDLQSTTSPLGQLPFYMCTISRRCSLFFILSFNISCYTYGCTTMFFPMGKKIDPHRKTYPSPLKPNWPLAFYKKGLPPPIGRVGFLFFYHNYILELSLNVFLFGFN